MAEAMDVVPLPAAQVGPRAVEQGQGRRGRCCPAIPGGPPASSARTRRPPASPVRPPPPARPSSRRPVRSRPRPRAASPRVVPLRLLPERRDLPLLPGLDQPQVVPTMPATEQRQQHQARRQHRPPVPPHELPQPVAAPTAGTPAPARRPGSAARPRRSRWPSRSGGCGPSPAPSSRSSPARRAPASSAWPAPCAAGPRSTASASLRVAQPRARLRRLLLADDPPHLVVGRLAAAAPCRTASCRSAARTAARPASRCRCGCRRPAPLSSACSGLMYSGVPTICAEAGEQRLLGQLLPGRLGHAEVDHLRHRLAVVERDQDVGRLEVAVDDPLLVGVLHRLADRHEQLQPLAAASAGCSSQYSVIGTPWTSSMTKYGRPVVGRAGVEDLGDVRVVHQRQGLPLGLEAGDHLAACPCPA